MSKKKTSKKHKFKHVDPEAVPANGAVSEDAAPVAAGERAKVLATAGPGRDFRYVASDVRRIMVMAVALVGLELVIYFVLGHTSAGEAIYRLVKI